MHGGITHMSIFILNFWGGKSPFLCMSDRAIRKAWSELPVEPLVTLPWQQGCWKTVIGGDPIFQVKPTVFKRSLFPAVHVDPSNFSRVETAKRSKTQTSAETSWKQMVKSTSEESWTELRDAQFQTALKRWLDVLLQLPQSCQVVLQLKMLGNVSQQVRVLRDTRRLHKHCSSDVILSFVLSIT